MFRGGYVLTGGKSSRMGVDKALLKMGEETLVEHVAREVNAAAGMVTLIGPIDSYRGLGLRVIEDTHRGKGPLSGIHAALSDDGHADWNLVVACDLPNVTAEFLLQLLEAAQRADADALLPSGPSGLAEPLCAVYHRRCFTTIDESLRAGTWKVTAALGSLRQVSFPVEAGRWFENANTPDDWQRILQERGARADL